jgi:hypothetical protein
MINMSKEENVSLRGVGTLGAIILLYIVIFFSYYPLSGYRNLPLLGVFLETPTSLFYLIFSVIGLCLVLLGKRPARRELAISATSTCLVWVSVQSLYIYNHWTPIIPFFSPTIAAVETLLMTLGFFALDVKKPRSVLIEGNYRNIVTSLGVGLILGLLFGLINLGFFVYLYKQPIVAGNLLYGSLKALQPGIVEETAWRLFFLGGALPLLSKHLPKRIAEISSISLTILFHAIPHVYQTLLVDPISSFITVIILSLLFGLPMTLLAYRRDIETAICFHWTIDAIRFILLAQ